MTHDLHEPLHDLVTDVPHHVVRDDLAARAWAAGRRRRTRRRMLGAGTLVVLLGLLGLTVTPALDRSPALGPAGSHTTVDGYPQRIGWPWWLRTMPAAPGAMAGVAWRMTPAESTWLVVSPGGRLWRLPSRIYGADTMPMLSPDGRHLGYLAADDGPYVLQDLTTGRRVTFPDVGSSLTRYSTEFQLSPQEPGFWSPDGRHLALFGGHRARPYRNGATVLGVDGTTRQVAGRRLLGWAADDALAWMDWRERTPGGVATSATLVVTDLSGRTRRIVPLDVTPQMQLPLDQWTGSLSPDKRSLALVDQDTNFGGDGRVRVFSTTDGTQKGDFFPPSVTGVCPTSWSRSTPVVPTGDATDALLWSATRTPRPVTVADPRAQISCLVLADDALAGTAHGWPLGTTTAWWSWHLRELLLGAAAALALLAGALRLRTWRRRRAGGPIL